MEPADRAQPTTAPRAAARPAAGGTPRGGRGLAVLAQRAEALLGRTVVGQPEAVASVARALRRAAAGLADARRPLATLLFVGPTGTGKTELARALAGHLGGPGRLLRIDCSEFGARHETSKLLGAPPGYVGHELGSVLARHDPARECVLLFDEVEKAHPHLHELLLQLLDEGRLTDGRGRRLDFRRAVVILTSNAGTRELRSARERLGFPGHGLDGNGAHVTVERALAQRFAPEFLARLDEVVLFRDLDRADLRTIAEQALLALALRVRAAGRRVCFTAAVARWAGERGARDGNGARGVLHCIRRELEGPLAEALLAIEGGEWIEVSIRHARPHFTHAA